MLTASVVLILSLVPQDVPDLNGIWDCGNYQAKATQSGSQVRFVITKVDPVIATLYDYKVGEEALVVEVGKVQRRPLSLATQFQQSCAPMTGRYYFRHDNSAKLRDLGLKDDWLTIERGTYVPKGEFLNLYAPLAAGASPSRATKDVVEFHYLVPVNGVLGQGNLLFGRVGAAAAHGTPVYPTFDIVESPRNIYGVLPVDSVVRVEDKDLPKPTEGSMQSKYFLLLGRHLADEGGKFEFKSADNGVRYSLVAEKPLDWKLPLTEFNSISWAGLFGQATNGMSKEWREVLSRLEVLLVRADFMGQTTAGIKKLLFNGEEVAWLLREGTATGDLRLVREVPRRGFFPTADVFKFDVFQFELRTTAPLKEDEFPVVVLQDGKPLAVPGSPLVVRRTASGSQVYRSEPVFVDDLDRASALRQRFKHTLAIKANTRFQALIGASAGFAVPPAVSAVSWLNPTAVGSHWKEALKEAAEIAKAPNIVDWNSVQGEQLGEIARRNWTEQGSRKVEFQVGHLAAMILLRRTFIQQMQAYLENLPVNPDEFPLDVWRAAIKPHINDPIFLPGLVMVTRSQGALVDMKEPFRKTFDNEYLSRMYGGVYSDQQRWIKDATREAYINWRKLLAGALKKAEDTKPNDLKAMLELTGQAFSPIANVVKSRLMRLEDQPQFEGQLWKPDIAAMDFVDSIEAKGEELRAIGAIADAERTVILSGASLIFCAPASLATRIACTMLNFVFVGEATVTANRYLQARGELAFAKGATVVLGNDRLSRAQMSQIPEWALAMSVLGAFAGLGGDALAWVEHVTLSSALARGAELLPAMKENSFTVFKRLAADDRVALMALITEAKAIRQNPTRTLTATHRRALELGDELERQSHWAAFARSVELGGPSKIFAPTVMPEALKSVRAFKERPMPVPEGWTIQSVDADGKVVELKLGKLIGKGLFAHVYEIPSRPGEVAKLYSDLLDDAKRVIRAGKDCILTAKRVAQRLTDRGIPQLEITEFHPDAPVPFMIQKRIPADAQLFDVDIQIVKNDSGQLYTRNNGLKGGKRLTPGMQRGFLKTYKMFGNGRDPLIDEDAHIGNFYFVPKGNAWEVGVLDHDRIAAWDSLLAEPSVWERVQSMQEVPCLEQHGIFSLLGRTEPSDAVKLAMSQKGRSFWPSADFFMEKVLEFKRYIKFNRQTNEFESFILDIEIVEEFYPNIRRHINPDLSKPPGGLSQLLQSLRDFPTFECPLEQVTAA